MIAIQRVDRTEHVPRGEQNNICGKNPDTMENTTIGLHDRRSKLGIIPQDPTLFQGTMRSNLDPLGQHSDHELWEVLDKSGLADHVRQDKRLLDTPGINETLPDQLVYDLSSINKRDVFKKIELGWVGSGRVGSKIVRRPPPLLAGLSLWISLSRRPPPPLGSRFTSTVHQRCRSPDVRRPPPLLAGPPLQVAGSASDHHHHHHRCLPGLRQPPPLLASLPDW